jgi:hypothetical protein
MRARGGTATVNDVTSETEIHDNDAVRYAMRNLEEQGKVDCEVVNRQGLNVTQATLTDEGDNIVRDEVMELEHLVQRHESWLENHSPVIRSIVRDLDDQGVIDIEEHIPDMGDE